MAAPTLALLRTQSDARLAALAREGHERAFEAIVERYRRELLRHGRRVVGEARAEDVVQHALTAAWTALRRGDDVRDLRPWLHRIVHNLSLNVLRGGRDEFAELRESMQVGGAPEEEVERRIIVRDTLAALAALPERQREALLQVAVQGRSQEEVAETFGLSHGAVRQLVHRARTALRAAATAVMPLPVASWLASVGREPVGARIAEMVSDSGSAGLASALAKAGAIVALAGSVAAGPAIVDKSGGRDESASAANARSAARPARSARPPAEPVSVTTAPPMPTAIAEGGAHSVRSGSLSRSSGRHHSDSGSRSSSGSSGPGPADDDDLVDRSGPGPGSGGGSSGSSGPGPSSDGGHSGSGSSGSGSSGSGTTESRHGGDSTESDSGSGKDGSAAELPAATPTPTPVPTPSPDSSGHGSSGSGSSDSGSGSSGSGGSSGPH
jgi:RNA polymerase sigma factor (sigma-70 family)